MPDLLSFAQHCNTVLELRQMQDEDPVPIPPRKLQELIPPPPLPVAHVYTSCYCEENVYLLAQSLLEQASQAPDPEDAWTAHWDMFVVFISNHHKTAALWNQKARENVVVWDYHVVLALRPRSHTGGASSHGETPDAVPWIYDLDSRCAPPSHWKEYMGKTFPYLLGGEWEVPEQYVSLFRVIPAKDYLDFFVSDRSHMLVQGQANMYRSEPPSYPPLRGRKMSSSPTESNLMAEYVSMQIEGTQPDDLTNQLSDGDSESYGKVMSMSQFLGWFIGGTSSSQATDEAR